MPSKIKNLFSRCISIPDREIVITDLYTLYLSDKREYDPKIVCVPTKNTFRECPEDKSIFVFDGHDFKYDSFVENVRWLNLQSFPNTSNAEDVYEQGCIPEDIPELELPKAIISNEWRPEGAKIFCPRRINHNPLTRATRAVRTFLRRRIIHI